MKLSTRLTMRCPKDVYKRQSKDSLSEMISEYLSESNCLIIDGFVTFRLKEYVKYLKRFTECSIEKVLMEAEHREFVRILKSFADMQEEKNEEVHLIKQPGGSFWLLDQDRKLLSEDVYKRQD